MALLLVAFSGLLVGATRAISVEATASADICADELSSSSCRPPGRPALPPSISASPGTGEADLNSLGLVTPDLSAPVITIESIPVTRSDNGQFAAVSFQATAIDNQDGPLRPTCLPAAGSLFSVGSTVVTCTATDAASNAGVARAEVVVVTSSNQILDITGPATVTAGLDTSTNQAKLIAALVLFSAGFCSLGLGLRNRRNRQSSHQHVANQSL